MSRKLALVMTALSMTWITSACDGPRVTEDAGRDAGMTHADGGMMHDDAGPTADSGPPADGGPGNDGGPTHDGGTMSDGGTTPQICGDGRVTGTETCDPGIAAGSPGACPTRCNDGIACTTDMLVGSAGACDARCTTTAITACTAGDSCCPSACTTDTDSDCSCTPRTSCGASECGTIDDGCGGSLDCGTCRIGGGCDVDADCASGVCVTEAASGWPGGICTVACRLDADCGSGSHCAFRDAGGVGACLANCGTGADCRSGYSCHDADGVAPNECAPTGSPTGGAIGAACANTSECAGGDVARCIVEAQGWAGGYCTRTCSSDTDCVGASHCGLIDADTGRGICMADCVGGGCRTPGYACWDVDGNGSTECSPSATGAGATGDPCRNTFECAGGTTGFCITSPQFIDGYCSATCETTSDCSAGGHCMISGTDTSGFCADNCTSDTDCRTPGYACYDANGDGTKECWAAATGSGLVGSPCQFIWQCAGGSRGACATEGDGFREGYCTILGCTAGGTGSTGCPSGTHCSVNAGDASGVCVDNCTSDTECRADGYRCYDTGDADTMLECWPAATGAGAVGASCAASWDCGGEELGFCITQQDDGTWPRGYCSRVCSDTVTCPTGSACVLISSDGTQICLDNCTGTGMGDCRAGYTCNANPAGGSNICF